MEVGRVNKTLYLLNYIDDEDYRRRILTQLNRGRPPCCGEGDRYGSGEIESAGKVRKTRWHWAWTGKRGYLAVVLDLFAGNLRVGNAFSPEQADIKGWKFVGLSH
jgi:hypothetical protein